MEFYNRGRCRIQDSRTGLLEQNPELLNYRGKGTYTRKVYIQEKTNIRLEFKGVSHTADVYFDDEFIVHHIMNLLPFAVSL